MISDQYPRQRDFASAPLEDVLGAKALVSWVQALRDGVSEGRLPGYVVATALAYTTWSDENGKDVWPSHSTIGRMVGRCARSVGRHYRILVEAGFLDRNHRFVSVGQGSDASAETSDDARVISGDAGDVRPTSNMTRFALPTAVLEKWRTHWVALRSAAARKASERRRWSGGSPSGGVNAGKRRRSDSRCVGEDCVMCSGSGWVFVDADDPDGPVVRCTGPPAAAGDCGPFFAR